MCSGRPGEGPASRAARRERDRRRQPHRGELQSKDPRVTVDVAQPRPRLPGGSPGADFAGGGEENREAPFSPALDGDRAAAAGY